MPVALLLLMVAGFQDAGTPTRVIVSIHDTTVADGAERYSLRQRLSLPLARRFYRPRRRLAAVEFADDRAGVLLGAFGKIDQRRADLDEVALAAVQVLAVQLSDRGLPRHIEVEFDVVPGAAIQPERAGQPLPVELLVGAVLGITTLDLNAGAKADRHVLDVDGVLATDHLDASVEVAARTTVRVREHGRDGRAADTDRLQQPLEDPGGRLPVRHQLPG